jgi:hypothetical protein
VAAATSPDVYPRAAFDAADGRFLAEQQAYVASRDGRITWMWVLCSGFRPIDRAG